MISAQVTHRFCQPQAPERADVLILESTYGDRLHEDRSIRQQALEQIIDKALEDNGTVLIPAFSIGRTQELLYELEDILRRKMPLNHSAENSALPAGGEVPPADWSRLPIILDSPLASRFTKAYQAFEDYWDEDARLRLDAGRKPLGFEQLITVDTHEEHLRTVNYLTSTARPAIVIAGNGMCAGGRIVNYLKAMLGDARHNVVFVGYQGKEHPVQPSRCTVLWVAMSNWIVNALISTQGFILPKVTPPMRIRQDLSVS